MTLNEVGEIAKNFMVYHELHEGCIETENLAGCDIFQDLRKIILMVESNAKKAALESDAMKGWKSRQK